MKYVRSWQRCNLAMAQWIRLHLPSYGPWFESQAYHLCFYTVKFYIIFVTVLRNGQTYEWKRGAGANVLTNLRIAKLHFSEIKYCDWLKIVMWLGTANQSALFQHCIVTLLSDLFLTSAPGWAHLFLKKNFVKYLVLPNRVALLHSNLLRQISPNFRQSESRRHFLLTHFASTHA